MSSIDERVVKMLFDNKQFEAGVKTTLASLDALTKGLKLEGATKGLDNLSNVGSSVHLGHIASAVDSISERFKALSVIGITALTNIVNKAVNAGTSLARSLSIEPILAGLHEYETNLGSIQTILANTGLEGEKGLTKVTSALDLLNQYSDQTIYNFGEMARNIGTFTAAGVTLDVATQAIKGIANLAAISGSSAEQASAAMYQLSQAISAGKLTLEDWNSVVNAGMGGAVFQRALMETARVHGVAIDQMIKDEGSFRLTLQNGWLSGEILTETLSKFTGDLTAAQLRAMHYNEQQIAQILKMAKTAQEAATKVKTMSQLISTLQEAVGSGWAKTWQLIFGDFNEARDLFTNVSNVLGEFVSASNDARNNVIGDWKELGGRTVLIQAISNAFHALIAVVSPIGKAFRQIFPATTGKQLYDLTVTLRNFTETLKIGGDTASKLQRTFAGVFAVFGIGFDIVKAAAKTLLNLFGIATEGSGGFLEITANIGDFLVSVRNAIREGNGLTRFFENVGKILAVPIKLLHMAGEALGHLFDKFDGQGAAEKVTGIVGKLEPFTKVLDALINAWSKLPSAVAKAWTTMLPFATKITEFFSTIGHTISTAFSDINFNTVFAGIATGGFAAVLLSIAGFIKKLKGGIDSEGIIDAITGPFKELTSTLKTMQNTLRATTLLQIAVAIGILTLSVAKLSKIDAAGLTRSLTAISVMFTQLIAAMAVFEKVLDVGDIAKIALIGAGLILLATAIDILASAVTKLATLDWNGLAKGLTGVTVLLAAVVAATIFLPDYNRLIATGLGLLVLGAAVKVLASAVTDLSGLSWEEMAKGLVGVGALLGSLILFTKFAAADKGGILQGAGLLLLAAAIKILASALGDLGNLSWMEIARGLTAMAGGLALMAGALYILPPSSVLSAAAVLVVAASLGLIADALKDMGGMSWTEIGKGLTSLAGALVLIAGALVLLPPSSLLSAAAILVVAASLEMIVNALAKMGGMSWTEIAKGLITLAGSLAIIAAAMYLMTGALPGAAAMLVVAASLAILAPVLQMFGKMSWEEMGKGLLMLAGVFVVLGVAGALLTPVVPTLIGLGVAITLLGVGMLAAGAGLLAFSIGLTALSVSGVAGAAAIVGIVSALVGVIPIVMAQIAAGIIAFAQVLATGGPAMATAMTVVLLAILQAIDTTSPRIVQTLFNLMELMLDTMLKHVPKLQDTGLKLLIAVLNGIANNMGGVVTAATNVIVAFLNGLAKNQPRVLQAGVSLIISYINGLANTIRSNSGQLNDAGWNLASAIIEGMAKGLLSGVGRIAGIARDVASSALEAAKNFLGVKSPSKEFEKLGKFSDEGLAKGLDKYSNLVAISAENVGKEALDALKASIAQIPEIVNASIDTEPRITPVLDLTNLKKNAGQIAKVLNGSVPISLNATYVNAASISESRQPVANDGSSGSNTQNQGFTFNQYNTSPKALSSADLYRQTRNQLSAAKGALTG